MNTCTLKKIALLCIIVLITNNILSQDLRYNFPDTLVKKRRNTLLIIGSLAYTTSLAGLYNLWYKDYPQSNFHFFNDNKGWMQADKLGHFTSTYHIGRLGYLALRWAGIKEKKAVWIGGTMGLFYLTTVEVFDGFSAEWGASPGDVIANTSGALLFISQQLIWKEQRIMPKFSFHTTEFAAYNPEQLGTSFIQQALKDYNGHTYWLSFNIKSFLFKESKLPTWLSISVGYGANGMIGAGSNPNEIDGRPIPEYTRKRRYFLAPEIDLSRIKTRSTFLNALFDVIGFIKVPLPALEYNKIDNFKFHWIYF